MFKESPGRCQATLPPGRRPAVGTLSAGAAQREETGQGTRDHDRPDKEHRRRRGPPGLRQGFEIGAGDPRGDALSFYGPGVQEDEALLVLPEELPHSDVLDRRGGRTRPILLGGDGLEGYGDGGGPAGAVVGAGAAGVDVVYVLYAGLWQVLHLEGDLHAVFDLGEGGRSAHPGTD